MKERVNRRDFVKIAFLSGVGLPVSLSPLVDWWQTTNVFRRVNNTRIYAPDGQVSGPYVFVLVDRSYVDIGGIFHLEKEFSNGTTSFLIGFYDGDHFGDSTNDEVIRLLSGKLPTDPEPYRKIIWLQSFDQGEIRSCPMITIDRAEKVDSFVYMVHGKDDDPQKVYIQLEDSCKAFAIYDANRNSIRIKASAGEMSFFANGRMAYYTEMEVPLQHSPVTLEGFTTQVKNNLGTIRFKTSRIKDKPIRPFSPYINTATAADGTTEPHILKVQYFEEASLLQNTDLVVSYSPFRNMENGFERVSFIEFALKNDKIVRWNGVDQFGAALIVDDLTHFICRMTKIDNAKTPIYLFIPDGRLTLKQAAPKAGAKPVPAEMLLGYSGTERVSMGKAGLNISFVRTKDIQFTTGSDILTPWGQSITSQVWVQTQAWYLDAERAPLFSNKTLASSFISNVKYEAINIGLLPPDDPARGYFPIIPTLSFIDYNPGEEPNGLARLKDLEKIFTRIRIKTIRSSQVPPKPTAHVGTTRNVASARLSSPAVKGPVNASISGTYVTPQGFLKKAAQLDYIRIEPNTKKSGDNPNPNRSTYRFSIKKIDTDFNLSISKEDVFLVLTPSLIDTIGSTKLDIFFGIQGFDIDLNQKSTAPADSENILIFKFSKHSVDELLGDVMKWSNEGLYKEKADLLRLQTNIRQQFKQFDANAGNGDYAYIQQTIRKDPNWNGVLILNVPLGSLGNLPDVLSGLMASQSMSAKEVGERLPLKTPFNFKYVALPVNKTAIQDNEIKIRSTTFYGLIDYDLFEKDADGKSDQEVVRKYMSDETSPDLYWKFAITKLLIRFENSEVRNFRSYLFLKIKGLFDTDIKGFQAKLANDGPDGTVINNLIRMEGSYQKNSNEKDEYNFSIKNKLHIDFEDGNILKSLEIDNITFSYSEPHFRFDIDAGATPGSWAMAEIFSIEELSFKNIGLKFPKDFLKLPHINFDLSKLFVLPKINFNLNGFLSSFPIKWSMFQIFKFKRTGPGDEDADVDGWDFLKMKGSKAPHIDLNISCPLFCFIFDIDLGNFGILGFLKGLKGQLALGWSRKGGFVWGIKINGSFDGSIHINLFGAMELDIDRIQVCPVGKQYLIVLDNIRLGIFGFHLPAQDQTFSGLIFAHSGNQAAWLISYVDGANADVTKNKVKLLLGQRVSIPAPDNARTVTDAFNAVKTLFSPIQSVCGTAIPDGIYAPRNNWLVGSEDIIPEDWKNIVDLKFIFNEPTLYGIYISILGLFSVDILYKKISEELGCWSLELALDPSIRTIDAGEFVITLPNLGIDIYTNGDWRMDMGYPKGSDWSRSCLVQLRPFLGWGGMYVMKSTVPSLTLFGTIFDGDPEYKSKLRILQAGMAMRVGIGAYIDKGVFYVGASISVYGIMEGAFAFEKGGGVSQLLPKHFVLSGRVGAIAEVVGYVNFFIVKATIHLVLRVEVGMRLTYLGKAVPPHKKGLQPVDLYIEGEVIVELDFTIACFKIFGHRICISIHLSFHAFIRFPFTIGGGGSSNSLIGYSLPEYIIPNQIVIPNLTQVPVVFVPSFTHTTETPDAPNYLIYNFAIPFFGIESNQKLTCVSQKNILKDGILSPILDGIFTSCATDHLLYSDLRNLLLKGKFNDEDKEIPLSFPNFRPVFLTNVSRPAMLDKDYTQFLSDHFFLNDQEAATFFANTQGDPCLNTPAQCVYRCAPLPISSRITVVDVGQQTNWSSSDKGFNIHIEGIFQDGSSLDNDFIVNKIYTTEQLHQISEQFDAYKTQFVTNMKPAQPDHLLADLYDLREDVMISEYFRLMALLALEAYFSYLTSLEKNRKVPGFNPIINRQNLFLDESDAANPWNFNDHIEDVLGQLNYFYSNGLRIKDLANNSTLSISNFQALQQVKVAPAIIADKDIDLSKIKVILSNKEGSRSVDLKNDLFPTAGDVTSFLSGARASLPADFTAIKTQFTTVIPVSPYDLVNVNLPVANSHIGSNMPGAFRFFEVPVKVRERYTGDKKCVLSLYRSDKEPFVPAIICSNIEVKVKPVLANNVITALELSPAFIGDLYLMTLLHNSTPELIETIALYLKGDGGQLIPLTRDGLTLIKTNLSVKTQPPVILAGQSNLMPPIESKINYADIINDKINFIRILWEGLATNNGGYYLVNKNAHAFDNLPAGKKEYSLLLSFEANKEADTKPLCGFNNYFKVSTTDDLFTLLDQGDVYLSAKVFLPIADTAGRYPAVTEYQSKIPAHCFSFEVERVGNVNTFLQYIPVDLDMQDNTGNKLIARDDFFPLMPQSKKGVAGKVYYSHITPLLKINPGSQDLRDQNLLNRYSCINREFQLDFSLRDSYGFRATQLPIALRYKHFYFDKLIPMGAWPFIKYAYHCTQAGPDISWEFKVQFSQEDGQALINGETNEKRDSVLNTLWTIKAQLQDANVQITLNNLDISTGTDILKMKLETKQQLEYVVNTALNFVYGAQNVMPAADSYVIPFTFKRETLELRTLLSPSVTIARATENVFAILPDSIKAEDVWGYDDIRRAVTTIPLAATFDKDAKKAGNGIKELDSLLTNSGFRIGVGANDYNETLIFIIRDSLLSPLTDNIPIKAKDNYFGIRPYSTSLWSGTYQRTITVGDTDEDLIQSFSDIDLDEGLRIILRQIDHSLSPEKLNELDLKNIDDLIECKKVLVKDNNYKLSELSGENAELSGVLENIIEVRGKKDLDFENLLLTRLNNLYTYSGLISTKLPSLPELAGHRLTLGLNDPDKFGLVSSKLFYKKDNLPVDWSVLFKPADASDTDAMGAYSFLVQPQVTHIEYDIQIHDETNGIDGSKWVQLVRPVKLAEVKMEGFPAVTRIYPPKPLIVQNSAIQVVPDGKKLEWSSQLGKWNYLLGIKKEADHQKNDKIHIELAFTSLQQDHLIGEGDPRSFPNFIAYWSSRITAGTVNIIKFIAALKLELSKVPSRTVLSPAALDASSNGRQVILLKKETLGDEWILDQNGPVLFLSDDQMKPLQKGVIIKDIGNLFFAGMNIFEAPNIVSVKPTIWLTRNETVVNPNFRYSTSRITPANWTTIHLQYLMAIVSVKGFKSVIDTLPHKTGDTLSTRKNILPVKITAKYLLAMENIDQNRNAALPSIPIQHVEMQEEAVIPQEVLDPDQLFAGYQNGYRALSLTVYNSKDGSQQNELPVFQAETIFKLK